MCKTWQLWFLKISAVSETTVTQCSTQPRMLMCTICACLPGTCIVLQFVNMYVHASYHILPHINTHMCETCRYMYMHICGLYMCVYVYSCAYSCVCIYRCTYIHVHTHVHIHVYSCTYSTTTCLFPPVVGDQLCCSWLIQS